jgi:MFS family permease
VTDGNGVPDRKNDTARGGAARGRSGRGRVVVRDGAVRRTGYALARGVGATGRGAVGLVDGTGRRVRRLTGAHGARETGLAKLIELHAVNSFGDVLITVSLASTVFFAVPTGEARGRVALYLLVTMAPFALLAPVIGPLLDRLPHGRRSAMAAAMLARAALAWVMVGAVASGSLELYPMALGVLVASKAYGVVRSAVVPRLLPSRITLVKANSKVTMAGLITTALGAGVGAGLHAIGSGWPLRAAFVVFAVGAGLAFSLPHTVDSAKGEERARLAAEERGEGGRRGSGVGGSDGSDRSDGHAESPERDHLEESRVPGEGDEYGQPQPQPDEPSQEASRGDGAGEPESEPEPEPEPEDEPTQASAEPEAAAPDAPEPEVSDRPPAEPAGSGRARAGGSTASTARKPGLRSVGPGVVLALQANAAIRWLSGFLTMFLAFLIREHPFGGYGPAFALGAVVVAAGVGNALGTAVGAWLKARAPEVIVTVLLGAALAAALAATLWFGTVTAVAVAGTAGFAQALGKLSLDALIQRDVPEQVRTSAFARSETLMQLGWVLGGGVGIILPLDGTLGLGVASAVLVAGLLECVRLTVRSRYRRAGRGRAPRVQPRRGPGPRRVR